MDVAQESFIPVGDWDPNDEKKLVRKMDIRILIPCFVMMFIGYLVGFKGSKR